MKTFSLEHDEFLAAIGFLNAAHLVGMDEELFGAFSNDHRKQAYQKMEEHGWLSPADRPDTWHMDEDLMQSLAVAVAPHFAVLARSKAHKKSVIFYVASDEVTEVEVTEIVVTEEGVVVVPLDSLNAMAIQVVEFLDGLRPAELIVARVRDEKLDAGHRSSVDAEGKMTGEKLVSDPEDSRKWDVESVQAFIAQSMTDLTLPSDER